MNKRLLVFLAILFVFQSFVSGSDFVYDWSDSKDRIWVGSDFWANRLQDWQIRNGRLECINGWMSGRTVHLLTRRSGTKSGSIQIGVRLGLLSGGKGEESGYGGV